MTQMTQMEAPLRCQCCWRGPVGCWWALQVQRLLQSMPWLGACPLRAAAMSRAACAGVGRPLLLPAGNEPAGGATGGGGTPGRPQAVAASTCWQRRREWLSKAAIVASCAWIQPSPLCVAGWVRLQAEGEEERGLFAFAVEG